jgi:hypothetical protein
MSPHNRIGTQRYAASVQSVPVRFARNGTGAYIRGPVRTDAMRLVSSVCNGTPDQCDADADELEAERATDGGARCA